MQYETFPNTSGSLIPYQWENLIDETAALRRRVRELLEENRSLKQIIRSREEFSRGEFQDAGEVLRELEPDQSV